TPINLRFTAFNLFYQRVAVNSKNSPLNKVIDKTEHLTLNNSQRSFSFEFINVLSSLHSKTLYNWKLEGFDKEWSASTKEHKAVYTNVPAGDYKFIIKATNIENQRESVTRYIDLTINPPFWASSVALFIYFILIIALGYFIIRFWKNRIEVKHSEERIRFFVNMAHDVRTPITLVKAPLNEIEHENLTDNGRSALSLAQRNLDKLFNLITQLLDFQRVESDAMQLNVEETALNEFMTNAIGNFSQLAKEKNIELDIILPPDEFNVWIDRKKLTLCLENLLSNAIKYTATAGKIQARVSTNESLLFIEIADDGIGIPLKNQKNLFERFFRAENAINSNETGSGIGLMLTKKLVLMQKGKISFKSIERLGTTFTLEIPCSKDAFKPTELIQKNDFSNNIIEEEDIEESISLKKIKILLVEDNNEIRDYLSKQLRREYRVEEAPDGNKALELAKKTAPDFILSDIMMPGIDGFELCSILKRNIETCHIPILLLSSLSDRADIVKGLSVGADDYITKPFDMAILEMKIKSIVNNRILFKKKFIDKSAIEDEFGTINPLDKQFLERVIIYVEENLIN
ncbi:MAG: response regulator, partial [Bacteroidota bacterium]